MAKKLSTDLLLLAVTVALLGFGLVMVWSASSALAQERHGSPYYFLLKQVAWGVLGLVGMVAALRLDYRTLRRPAVVYSLLIVSTVLLIGVLFLSPVNETHRWIRLGALSFQPAELAKLAMVLFLAYHVERRAERVNELTTLFPALLLLGWFGFLILIQPDLGTAFCLVLTGAVMLYVAGVRLKYFAGLADPRGRRAVRRGHDGALAPRARHELHQPLVRPAGAGLPGHPEPHRGGHGRGDRGRASWRAGRSSSTCPTRTATSSSP